MKKMIFVLLAAFAVLTNAFAQGQGNVNVLNQTGCDIYVNAHAICPPPGDCSVYSPQLMVRVAPSPVPQNLYSGGVPWYPTAPNCSDWQWDYIWIDIICDDGVYPIIVGNPNSPCNVNNAVDGVAIPQECADACHGGNTLVQASWSPQGSDILVIVW